MHRGVNDTTNSAVKTGLLIAGGRQAKNRATTCHMHTQELVVGHALGIKARTRNKLPIEPYETGVDLRDKVKNLLSAIMTKKKKYRFKAYHDYCLTLGMNVRRLELTNETRVSGIFLM